MQRCIVFLLQFMSVISVASIYLSNPGFVTDYFRSEELEQRNNQRRFAVYKKKDYEARQADAERAIDVKPLRIVQVVSEEENLFFDMSVKGFYCFKYCKKCEEVKPPRAHHCSLCGKCIMKMDHHCPWTGNCIGLLNHKKFWLFLFYSVVGLFTMGMFLL